MNDSANAPLQQPAEGPLLTRTLLHELFLAALALVVGVVVMPCVIFAFGRASLGPYEHGGVFSLWHDFLVGLGRGSQAFWFVAIAPYLLLCVARVAARLLHK